MNNQIIISVNFPCKKKEEPMKRNVVECLILALLLFVIPLFAMGGAPREENGGETSSAAPAPEPESADTADDFAILDTSTGNVIHVSRLEFLRGGAAAEIPPSYELEAIKAQAAAAYTYYARLREQQEQSPDPALKGADFSANLSIGEKYVTPELMKSRYGDRYEEYYAKLDEAAHAVNGLVLRSGGELIDAVFYAISAGVTESSADIWGGERSYLVPVASPGDCYAAGYRTSAVFSAEELKTALLSVDASLAFGDDPAAWLTDLQRTGSGSVLSLNVGGVSMDGGKFRSALGLRSQNFTFTFADNSFTFTVCGYGHGVGMSQVGAQYMAEQGASWEDILHWYYPGISIEAL